MTPKDFCHSSYSCDPSSLLVPLGPSDLPSHVLKPQSYNRYSNVFSVPFTQATMLWLLLPAPMIPNSLEESFPGGQAHLKVESTDRRGLPVPSPQDPWYLPLFSLRPALPSPEGPVSPSAENLLWVPPSCCLWHVSLSAQSGPFVGGPVCAHRQGPLRPGAARLLHPCPASSPGWSALAVTPET